MKLRNLASTVLLVLLIFVLSLVGLVWLIVRGTMRAIANLFSKV